MLPLDSCVRLRPPRNWIPSSDARCSAAKDGEAAWLEALPTLHNSRRVLRLRSSIVYVLLHL